MGRLWHHSSGGYKMAKKGIMFWAGVTLIVGGVLQFVNLGIISQFASQLLPVLVIIAGLYMVVNE